MAHRRNIAPTRALEADALTSAMVGIGMRFASEPNRDANIEDTLLAASIEGVERDDARVLALLVTWLSSHSRWINADRLVRIAAMHPSWRVSAFWSAIGRWREKDQRLARLMKLYRGERIDLLRAGTAFQVRRRGEDERFMGSPLRVPKGVLRDRTDDVLAPGELACLHAAYRWRVIIGPTYRADMWAALEKEPSLSPAELARRTYGSFASAWQVKRDFAIAMTESLHRI